MPESKGRRRPTPRQPPPLKRSPLHPRSLNPPVDREAMLARRRERNDPAREIPAERRYQVPELPEPASRDQVLVALARLDPLAQEVMLAARLASFPHPQGNVAINISENVRGPWAHQLRKLGVFCVPELATHELVRQDRQGQMTPAAELESIDRSDLWEVAKKANPKLAELVDGAKTPAQKRKAMRVLAAKLPVEQRLALEKLIASAPEDLEPT